MILELPYRDELPAKKDPKNRPNFFRIMKDSVGKDKVSMPVYVNEPLSLL